MGLNKSMYRPIEFVPPRQRVTDGSCESFGPERAIEHLDWHESRIYLLDVLVDKGSYHFRRNGQFRGPIKGHRIFDYGCNVDCHINFHLNSSCPLNELPDDPGS